MDWPAIIGLSAASLSVLAAIVAVVRAVKRRAAALSAQVARLEAAMRVRDTARTVDGCYAMTETGDVLWLDEMTPVVILGIASPGVARCRLKEWPVEVSVELSQLHPGSG